VILIVRKGDKTRPGEPDPSGIPVYICIY
jgi:hypothetical protein